MDRVFSVDEISEQFWLPPPPKNPQMNRSSSEWAFQQFLQEAEASSASNTTSSSKTSCENDVIEIKDRVYQKNNPPSDLSVNQKAASTAQHDRIPSHPAPGAAMNPFNTGSSIRIDSDEYQEILKSRLNLACAAVALKKAPFVIGQSSTGMAEPKSTSQGSADSNTLVQPPRKALQYKDGGGPVGVPLIPAIPKKIVAQSKQSTSGSSRELSDDDDAECENETTGNLDPKKVRRKLSNRESARRSRRRKQAHLTELETQVAQLKVENSSLLTRLTNLSQKYNEAAVDNRILQADIETMRAKVKMAEETVKRVTGMNTQLQSLCGISSTMRRNTPSFNGGLSSDSADDAVPVLNSKQCLYQPLTQPKGAQTFVAPEVVYAEIMLPDPVAPMAGVAKVERTPSMHRVASLEHPKKKIYTGTVQSSAQQSSIP